MPNSLRRWIERHRTATVSVSALIVAAAITMPLAISSSAGQRSAEIPVPAVAVARLRALALRAAAVNGDPHPAWAIAVGTTFAKAMAAVGGGDTMLGNPAERVYVLLIKGDFTANNAPGPPGAPAPTGHYLSDIVDAGTFAGIEDGLTAAPPPVALQSLGLVSTLS